MTQMSTPENQSLYGETPLPGESWSQFLQRTGLYKRVNTSDPNALKSVQDAFSVKQLQQEEEAKSRGILDEQSNLQKSRLQDLTTLLAKQQNDQFRMDIPNIAENAQQQGMLETSGFGGALANRYKELTTNTSNELAKQSLDDRDLQIKGLTDIGTNSNNLATAGTQREFSNEDLASSDALARELAKLGVPAPAKQPSTFDKAIQYGGPILSGVGAVKGA